MDNSAGVSGEQFIGQVAPLMVRLFCLPAEQRKVVMAALLGDIEKWLESFESLNRHQFLALFQRTLNNEDHAERCQDAETVRTGVPV